MPIKIFKTVTQNMIIFEMGALITVTVAAWERMDHKDFKRLVERRLWPLLEQTNAEKYDLFSYLLWCNFFALELLIDTLAIDTKGKNFKQEIDRLCFLYYKKYHFLYIF